ncbi:MAG TPA: hypothetical protein VJ783_24460 [Pirellulales bacterium]|nr:hypothetical protein [Pirellulales bacterium]
MLRFPLQICFGLAVWGAVAIALPPSSAQAQPPRGPRDYFDRGDYSPGDYDRSDARDQVFDGRVYEDSYADRDDEDAYRRSRRYDSNDESFSESYPNLPPARSRAQPPSRSRAQATSRSRAQLEADEDNYGRRARTPSRPASRYRRYSSDYVERNAYAGAPVRRHYYGGYDRYDSPGYLDDAGRAASLANGYSQRGVEQYRDMYGRGVRTNDVYPLQRNVNPRRWRGRDLNGSVAADDEDTSGADEVEDLIRKEMSVRPGANLRVSSSGTYTMRNYVDTGNQVHARFRLPVHKRWAYGRGP